MSILSRRTLLKTLAVGAGAAPVLTPLGRHLLPRAHAGTTGAPRRIVFIENPNGLPNISTLSSWFYKAGTSYADGQFGTMLQQVTRHRDDMVVIQNLESKFEPINGTSNHNNYSIQLLTGSAEQEKPQPYWGRARNASIDYHMSRLVGTMVTPKFPQLLPGVQAEAWHTHDDQGNKIDHVINPYDLYAQLFSSLVTGNTQPDPAMVARLANRKSVLDYVANDIVSFQKQLGADDRMRADVQLDTIRTLENRLAPLASATMAACSPKAVPTGLNWNDHIPDNIPQLMDVMGDIVTTAMACDLTRIVTWMNWGRDDHNSCCNFDPIDTVQGWHSLSHLDPNIDAFSRAKVWMTGVVGGFVDKLKAIPEAGGTMLDNTLVVMLAEHGWDHNGMGLQFATFGGKNLGVKTGNYINCGKPSPQGAGLEVNRFLVSLLNMMGVAEDTWGVQDPGKGPLDGFLTS